MTREEASNQINDIKTELVNHLLKKDIEALDMAISALEKNESAEEWYKLLCEKWDSAEELSEDGTLTVHVSDGSKVKRVFVMGDNIFGGLYYPDSAESKWIPVSERLPEMGVRVLCACQANLYDVLKLTPDGWFYDTRHTYMLGFVLAWQPLPEPYKKGE